MFTQSLTCGFCYGSGDCFAQRLEKAYSVESPGKTGYNYNRTLRMGLYGLCFGGPAMYTWYLYLHRMTSIFRYKYVPIQSSAGPSSWVSSLVQGNYKREVLDDTKSSARNIFVKVAFDQIFFAAAHLNAYFMILSFMEGRSLQEAISKCKRDFHDSWAYLMLFWVPVQAANFALMPPQFNAVFVMMMNMVWTTLLSLLNHQRDYGADTVSANASNDSFPRDVRTLSGTRKAVFAASQPNEESAVDLADVKNQQAAERELELKLQVELEVKLQALRCKLIEERAKLDEQQGELDERRRQIDKLLLLTDENQLSRQVEQVQALLQETDGQSLTVFEFLGIVRRDDE